MQDIATLEARCRQLETDNEKLRKENESMQMMFDRYVITSETDSKGIIKRVSKPFERISGYTSKELVGKPHNIIRHPDMPKAVFTDLWKTIQSKKIWRGEVKNLKKNGGEYWVDTVIIPQVDLEGNITGYKAIRVDITPQKQLKSALQGLVYQEDSIVLPE